MIRVLIVDDHPVVRSGLRLILDRQADIAVVAEASSAPEALAMIRLRTFDVGVFDISMPGMSGMDLLRQARIERTSMPILILSIHPEHEYAVRALKAGASGYITKQSAPAELVEAVRRVAAGRKYVGSELAERLADVLGGRQGLAHEALSDRKYQVMCLLAQGKRPKEIAAAIGLSIKTVSTYRTRVFAKLGVASIASLIRYALQNDLLKGR